jgi:hypothetical protein
MKLPHGWKQYEGVISCPECWKQRFVLKSVALPVASPLNGSWQELNAVLKTMWQQTTSACNWIMTECYARDVRRIDQEKMPPMPRVYFYPELRKLFPALPSNSVSAIDQRMQRKYKGLRYEVNWVSRMTLPTMRYPQPFPVTSGSWKLTHNAQKQIVVSVRIGDQRWDLRLKSGRRYARQNEAALDMIDPGELNIHQNKDGSLMVRMAGWFEKRPPRADAIGTLRISTRKNHLIEAKDSASERTWVKNCDHAARWVAEHKERLRRLTQDRFTWRGMSSADLDKRRHDYDVKYRNRMNTLVLEVASHFASLAECRRIGKVLYDDSERWLEQFPYYELENRLRAVLSERGILFEKIQPDVESNGAHPDS